MVEHLDCLWLHNFPLVRLRFVRERSLQIYRFLTPLGPSGLEYPESKPVEKTKSLGIPTALSFCHGSGLQSNGPYQLLTKAKDISGVRCTFSAGREIPTKHDKAYIRKAPYQLSIEVVCWYSQIACTLPRLCKVSHLYQAIVARTVVPEMP